eukprot:g3570.t2
MSSPMAESALPATPDSQAVDPGPAPGGGSSASPMPPPPPFNTPIGGDGSSDVPAALGSGDGVEGVTSANLADMLSGVNLNEDTTADATAGAGSSEVQRSREAEREGCGNPEDLEEGDNEVELPPEVMKRLYQLKALQSEKDVIYDKYKAKRAELELEFASEYGRVYARRAEIVAGRGRDMDDSEGGAGAEDEQSGEVGVPHFWMQCMLHHEALHDVLCEPDLEALYYLSDVRCVDKEDLLGFTLEFHFDDNPYFTNAVLTKRYDTANIMDQGEPLLEGVEGTAIDWKSGRNLCEKTIRRKIKRGGLRSGETRTVTKVEKTESFFKFFQNPVMYDEEDEEEEDEEYNFSFDMDYEVARIFRNHLIPNAVLWFTGEAVSDVEDDEETDEEEGLEETEGLSDDEDVLKGAGDGEGGADPVKKLNFQAPTGFGAPPSGSADGKECKQS